MMAEAAMAEEVDVVAVNTWLCYELTKISGSCQTLVIQVAVVVTVAEAAMAAEVGMAAVVDMAVEEVEEEATVQAPTIRGAAADAAAAAATPSRPAAAGAGATHAPAATLAPDPAHLAALPAAHPVGQQLLTWNSFQFETISVQKNVSKKVYLEKCI